MPLIKGVLLYGYLYVWPFWCPWLKGDLLCTFSGFLSNMYFHWFGLNIGIPFNFKCCFIEGHQYVKEHCVLFTTSYRVKDCMGQHFSFFAFRTDTRIIAGDQVKDLLCREPL
jgi:hypothetical protein